MLKLSIYGDKFTFYIHTHLAVWTIAVVAVHQNDKFKNKKKTKQTNAHEMLIKHRERERNDVCSFSLIFKTYIKSGCTLLVILCHTNKHMLFGIWCADVSPSYVSMFGVHRILSWSWTWSLVLFLFSSSSPYRNGTHK